MRTIIKSVQRYLLTFAQAETGQSIFELAVIVPILFLVTVGIFDIGRYSYVAIVVENSAQTGAQYGAQTLATSTDYAGMKIAAQADASPDPTGFTASPSPTWCVCANGSASTCLPTDCSTSYRKVYVEMTSSATVNSLIKYPGIPQALVIVKTAVLQVPQ
ncbi:MAG TPA: TadE family protein [Candidatus Baltobacteraceae bacterium]|jgi:Flp pilus assembly protein TadG|nr:TadE family protein [Candidatus Baltobacteraceae bacterium]